MRNIGPVSRRWLHEAGIETLEDLRRCGVVPTYRLIRAVQPDVSLNLLWALEGAVQDCHWKDITPERKEELRRQVIA